MQIPSDMRDDDQGYRVYRASEHDYGRTKTIRS